MPSLIGQALVGRERFPLLVRWQIVRHRRAWSSWRDVRDDLRYLFKG